MTSYSLPREPRRFRMYIDGQFLDAAPGRSSTRLSPGHGVPVASWPLGSVEDADRAVAAARRAFDQGPWPRSAAGERATLLFKVADLIERDVEELGLIESLETGKPITQAIGEIRGAVDVWRFAAGAARLVTGESHNQLGERLLALVLRQPLGVVGLITPWNFPFFILAERLPFILAAGCTAVVKPAEATSGSTLKLCELLHESGLPAGVVNVVSGRGSEVGQRLLDSRQIDMVSVTGSTGTGRKAIEAAAAHIKKLGLELGGKNPHIVFADADLDEAADGVAFGMAFNAGQCCVGASRLVVDRAIADDFTARLAEKLGRIRVGDPLDPETQVGALFDEAHMHKVLDYVHQGVAQGARLVCGGARTAQRQGHFVQPTLLTNVRADMPLVREEIFGPVLAVLPFDGFDDALRIANDSEFGLSASIWTRDLSQGLRAMRQVQAGRVWVNTTLDNGPETPLGGMKQSGLGREAGLAGIEEYTEVKTVHINLQPRALAGLSTAMQAYDYIVVGAGSAGCALAARLSEDASVRVLLLEAGPPDRNPYIHLPVGFYKMTAGPLTWGLQTTPQRHAMNRQIPYAQARVLGGGGSINAQVFTRGCPQDYDAWALEFGCEGWSFADLQPLFLRSEDNDTLAGDWHGIGGPLGVSTPQPDPLTRAFVQACQQFGMPYNPDFNGPRQEGAGAYQTTTRGARRCSAAVGYLRPALQRGNLTLQTGAEIARLRIEQGRAIGVELVQGGRATLVRAEREVLLTAGAIGSPKLMLLSGLGPADELRALGIPVAADLPEVGRNLHDHFGIDIVYALNGPHSFDKYARPHWMAWAGLQYALFKKGPVASNIVEGGAFWYADRLAETPDLQFHFLVGAGVEAGVPKIAAGSGVTLNSYTVRPRARGSVRLASANAADKPLVDPNFLGDPYDLRTSVEGLRQSREIMRQSAFARYLRQEHFPGEGVRSQAELETYARQYGRTSYHPVGSCRMGGDAASVVDPQLRVRGIEGLRICDSSVMPRLVSSNTNAPSIVIAEKAAELLLGRAPRPRAVTPSTPVADMVRAALREMPT